MASTILDIDAGVVPRIQDAAGKLDSPARQAAIASALAEYQIARPREVVVALTGSGVFDYAIALLTGFVDGFSTLLQVVGPIVANDANPPKLETDTVGIVRVPTTGRVLRFFDRVPSASEVYHVYFTAPHVLTGTALSSTVPVQDDQALMDLSAHYCCLKLSAFYTQGTDGSIEADSVNHEGKGDTYRSMAASFRRSYEQKLSLGEAGAPDAAFATSEIDRGGFGNRSRWDLHFHGRDTH
jgi:hypothetical protein